MLSVIANVRSWSKRLDGLYVDCKIGDSWCSGHIDKVRPSMGWSHIQCVEKSSQVFRLSQAVREIHHSSRSPHYLCHLYQPEMEYNSHLWAGASKSALAFVDRIKRRALKYKFYFGKCSSGLSELIPPSQEFARNSRLSGRSLAFSAATLYQRTTHYS